MATTARLPLRIVLTSRLELGPSQFYKVNGRGYIYHRNNICNKHFSRLGKAHIAAECFLATWLELVTRLERQGRREYQCNESHVTLGLFARAGLPGRMIAWLELYFRFAGFK